MLSELRTLMNRADWGLVVAIAVGLVAIPVGLVAMPMGAAHADEPTPPATPKKSPKKAKNPRDQSPVEDVTKPPTNPVGARNWGRAGSVPPAPKASVSKRPISRPDPELSKAPGADRGPLPIVPLSPSQLPAPAVRGDRRTAAPVQPRVIPTPPLSAPSSTWPSEVSAPNTGTNATGPRASGGIWPTTAPSGPIRAPSIESFPIATPEAAPIPAPMREPMREPVPAPITEPRGYYPAPPPDWAREEQPMGQGDTGFPETGLADTGFSDAGFPEVPALPSSTLGRGMDETPPTFARLPLDSGTSARSATAPDAIQPAATPESLAGNSIDRIRKQHNLQTPQGDLALQLDTRFTTEAQAGREVFVAMWFLDRDSGERLQSADPAYADVKGALTAQSQSIRVVGTPAAYDSTLLIPYRAFPQMGSKPSYEIEAQALLLRREPSGLVLVLATGTTAFRVYGSGDATNDMPTVPNDAPPAPDDGMEDWSVPVPTEFIDRGPPALPRDVPAMPPVAPMPDRMPPSAPATPDPDAFSNPTVAPKAPVRAPSDGLPPPGVKKK